MKFNPSLHDEEAEKTLIIKVLSAPKTLSYLTKLINKNFFYNEVHKIIWESCQYVYTQSGDTFNYAEISTLMSKTYGDHSTCYRCLQNLITGGPRMDLERSVKQVQLFHARRQLLRLLDEKKMRILYEPNLEEILSETWAKGIEILHKTTPQVKNSQETINDLISQFDNSKLAEVRSEYFQSGLMSLDKVITGFFRSHLTVIASRPSMGKTSLICHLINKFLSDNYGCMIFSFETSEQFLMYRMLSNRVGVPSTFIQTDRKFISEQKLESLRQELRWFRELKKRQKLFVFDQRMRIETLLYEVNKAATSTKVDVVLIDFLQIFNMEGSKDDYIQIRNIMSDLKSLAIKYQVAIIVLSQLSRNVDSREIHRPQLHDLAHSSGIEMAADQILMLWSDNYYKERDGHSVNDMTMNVTVAKNRNGPIGEVKVYFDKKSGRFGNLAS